MKDESAGSERGQCVLCAFACACLVCGVCVGRTSGVLVVAAVTFRHCSPLERLLLHSYCT